MQKFYLIAINEQSLAPTYRSNIQHQEEEKLEFVITHGNKVIN